MIVQLAADEFARQEAAQKPLTKMPDLPLNLIRTRDETSRLLRPSGGTLPENTTFGDR